MKIKIPNLLTTSIFCLTLSLFGQTPSSEEAFLMGPEEYSKRLQEELKRANDPDTPWNRMSDKERELKLQLYLLTKEKMNRRSELLKAHVLLPREERIQNQSRFQHQTQILDDYYKAEEDRLKAAFASTIQLPPIPDKNIDRWEFLSLISIAGKMEFSLNNPWEKNLSAPKSTTNATELNSSNGTNPKKPSSFNRPKIRNC